MLETYYFIFVTKIVCGAENSKNKGSWWQWKCHSSNILDMELAVDCYACYILVNWSIIIIIIIAICLFVT